SRVLRAKPAHEPLPVGETGGSKGMGGGREGDHPPVRAASAAKRVCTTTPKAAAEDRGDPAAGAPFGALYPSPREGRSPIALKEEGAANAATTRSGKQSSRRSVSIATAKPARGTDCNPETG